MASPTGTALKHSGSHVERRLRRWTVDLPAMLTVETAGLVCDVLDISPGGARVRLTGANEATVGAKVELVLDDFPPITCEVRHRDGEFLGLMFLHGGEEEAALGRYLITQRPPRPEPRKSTGFAATLSRRRAWSGCIVSNISRMGASISIGESHDLAVGEEVQISIDGHGEMEATVRRIDGDDVAVIFKKAIIGELPG